MVKRLIFHKNITRRSIQIALGVLWLIDGFLQLQPQMFTSSFADRVVGVAAEGQPIAVAGPMHFFIHIFLTHPAIFNSFSAAVQIIIGILILNKRTAKIGLLGSVGWGLFVWWIGEGFGGLFGWHTLILMGAPGAALIYVIMAIAALPSRQPEKSKTDKNKPANWLYFIWAIFWVIGSIYQLLPGQGSVSNVSSMIAGNGAGQPGWLASLDNHIGSFINGFGSHATAIVNMHMSAGRMLAMHTQNQSGYWFIVLIAFVQLCIGLAIFLPKPFRVAVIGAGILLSLFYWVIGQSFGGIFTGLGTDPNAAILFILLGIAILGCDSPNKGISRFFDRLEKLIT